MSFQPSEISLRGLRADDREMIFRWRNDPFILAYGSSNREVLWNDHAKWFKETMAGYDRRMYVVTHQNTPIGQVRFDRKNVRDCIISLYLLQEFTGYGWGVQAIREGCSLIFDAWDVETTIACVRNDNPRGRSAFLKAGFEEAEMGECPVNHYTLVLRRKEELKIE